MNEIQRFAVFVFVLLLWLCGLNAQTVIHRTQTVCQGQTGSIYYMDTLFFDNFNSGNVSCWRTYKSSTYVNDWAPAESMTDWNNPSAVVSAYEGKSIFCPSVDVIDHEGIYDFNGNTYSKASFLETPSIYIANPEQTQISFRYVNQGAYLTEYGQYAIDQMGVIATVNGSLNYIWGPEQANMSEWATLNISLSGKGVAAGNNEFQFGHANYGAVGTGIDEVLIYGPRMLQIPAELEHAAVGTTFESSETVQYRIGCEPTTIITHWEVTQCGGEDEIYLTVCEGQTGVVRTVMDTLFYEDFENGVGSCWNQMACSTCNGFSASTRVCLRGDNTQCMSSYQGLSAFEQVPSSVTSNDPNVLSQYMSLFMTPEVYVADPSSTVVSFYYYNEAYSDNYYSPYYGWQTTEYYDEVGLIVVNSARNYTYEIWGDNCDGCAPIGSDMNDVYIWTKRDLSLDGQPSGSTNFAFGHVNQGGLAMGLDNIYIYGPRQDTIPAEVSQASAGEMTTTTVRYYRNCTPRTLTIHWTILPKTSSTVDVVVQQGESYTWQEPEGDGNTYSVANTYSKAAGKGSNGCDSMAYLNLSIASIAHGDVYAEACNSYDWNGSTYTLTGSYDYSCTACSQQGFDSTTTLHLTILPSYNTDRDTTACNSLTLGGTTYNEDTTVTLSLTTTSGCDSIVNYAIRVNPSYTDLHIDTSACQTLTYDGVTYNATTTLTLNGTTTAGCDSIVHVSITINATYEQLDTIEQCYDEEASIAWRHTVLPAGTISGDYSLDTFSTAGCDSLFRLHLVLNGSSNINVTESTVENDLPHIFNGVSFSQPTTDTIFRYTDRNGCDSTVNYTLEVFWNSETNVDQEVCFSALPYEWNGETFAATDLTDPASLSGIIEKTTILTASTGADSTLHMVLHVKATASSDVYDTTCDNHRYATSTATYTFPLGTNATRQYYDTLRAANGCDSVVSLHLRIYPSYDHHFNAETYSNALPYSYGTYTCYEDGAYRLSMRSQHGCDSLETMHLVIVPLTLVDTSVCVNHLPLRWHGQEYYAARMDTTRLQTKQGGDSLVVVGITIKDTSAYYDHQKACNAYTWLNGQTYSSSTTEPRLTYRNSKGCDSVVHLVLSISQPVQRADHIMACDNYTWLDGQTYEQTVYGPRYVLKTPEGCDSTLTLDLHIAHSSYTELMDSLCNGSKYTFHDQTLTTAGTYIDSLLTADGCDSIVVLHLALLPTPIVEFNNTYDCERNLYFVELNTDVDYVRWSSYPTDSTLEGQETQRSITVHPLRQTAYTVYVDYLATPTCPTTATLALSPLDRAYAAMRTSPDYLSYDNYTLQAADLSKETTQRRWYINGFLYPTDDVQINYKADPEADSVVVMLEVSNGFCKDTAKRVVPILNPTLFVPTVFTPLLSTNRVFQPQGNGILEYEIHIFNRNGLQVFTSRDIELGWDGKHGDTPCPQGTYVYTIRYRDISRPDSYKDLSGSVTLLR